MVYENYSGVMLLTDRFKDEGIKTGSVGYIIEVYDDGNYEVEFSDSSGITIALVVVNEDEIALYEREE